MVAEGLVLPDRQIEIKVTGEAGSVRADLATPLAVTLTELLQNAIDHAFPHGAGGTIAVEVGRDGHEIVMIVRDDGAGIPGGALKGARLGLQIVRSLIEEMSGTFEITSEGGTRIEVRVPVKP